VKIISILCILSSSCFAASPGSATSDPDNVYLRSGAPAPYEGILMPLPRAQRVNVLEMQAANSATVVGLQTDEMALMNTRINNAATEKARLAKSLESERSTSFLSKAGYFILGAAVTGLLSYGAMKAYK